MRTIAWRLEEELPKPYSEFTYIGMVFLDDQIPIVKQFKGKCFFPISISDYIAELLTVVRQDPPGKVRDYFMNSLIKAIRNL